MKIDGAQLGALATHRDERGSLTEIFRDEWVADRPVQWNHVRSEKGVLRGVHGHFQHSDYLVVVAGSAVIGLHDLRTASSTYGQAEIALLEAANLQSLTIPPGVAHGFYFPESAVMVYSVTHYFQGIDELGCRWDDPALGIEWPFDAAVISARDAALPSFAVFREEMQEQMKRSQPRNA